MDEELNESKKNREKRLLEAKKIREENEKNKLLQEKKKKEELEQDNKLLEDQNKLIELQDKKKMEEMKAKEKRMQALAKYAEENIGKKDLDKKKIEEIRFMKDALEREKREQLVEEKRKMQHRQNEVNARKLLDEQVKQKELKKEEERKKSKKLAEFWEKDAEDFTHEQKTKQIEYKKKHYDWHNDILKQISEKKDKTKKAILMNEREFLFNKQLIDDAIKIPNETKEGITQ